MPQLIIGGCLCVLVLLYVGFSLRVGNFVNILTPFLLFEIPAYYILEPLYIHIFGRSGSDYAYSYCYATYTVGIIATAVGFLGMPAKPLPLVVNAPSLRIPGMPILFLLAGAALYAPVLLAYPNLLTSPREIYAATRTGFGINFFLSSFAVYVGYIIFLFDRRRSQIGHVIFFLVAVAILYIHGSKGHVLQLFLIALFYAVFVRQTRFNFLGLLVFGTTAAIGILTLFYLTSSAASRVDMVENIAGYSDYTRNSMLVIDDPDLMLQKGKLTAEESVYSLAPRAIFPNKPTNFGALWLAQQYFPERFAANTGAPAFGLGVVYADFGDFAIVYWAITSLLTGMTMRALTSKLRVAPDAGTFTLLLVFLNIQIIPAGAHIPLLFYYLCAVIVRMLSNAPRALLNSDPAPVNPNGAGLSPNGVSEWS